MKSTITPVKGTRDFYPEQMAIRNWLYSMMRKASEAYGYQEYDGPFLEYIELYAAKSGEELVKEQAFTFQDRGGDWITLRPELTPSLARMVAQKQRHLPFPLRWWSFGPMWRYERPQKGRVREFYQWNADLIGADSPEADAELVALAVTFFQNINLSPDEVQIMVNNRRLVDVELTSMNIPLEQRPQIFRLIDKKEKMPLSEWENYAIESGLTPNQLDKLISLLNNPNLWQKSDELCRFFAALEAYGVSSYVHYAPEIIRGLDYYTGTVFEARDKDGEFRAILGGGRYDNLVADVGGQPLPGVGFAMGDVVMTLVLQKYNKTPDRDVMRAPVILVTVFDERGLHQSIHLSSELRRHNLNVVCYQSPAKLEKQLKYGDAIKASLAIIIGPEENARNQVTIRNLLSREQRSVDKADLISAIEKALRDKNISDKIK